MKCPPIPLDLLEYLQAVFPDKLPEMPTTLENLGMLCGQQKVIRHLKAQYQAQAKSVLAPENT